MGADPAAGVTAGSVSGTGDVRGWLLARPLLLLAPLDFSAVLLSLAAFLGLADPDILFHCVWIVLCIEAFVFGGRLAATRIAVACAIVVGYWSVATGDETPIAAALSDLDLEEWPLMAVIVSFVAVMADRVSKTGSRYAALYRRTSDRLLTAQEDERRRLASELHDGVGQTLTALTFTLDALATRVQPVRSTEPPAGEAVARGQELTRIALEEVRGVAFRLRPQRLEQSGLVAAVRELGAMSGATVSVEANGDLVRPNLLAPEAEANVYRIVQEALGNATRHASATRVTVRIHRDGKRLVVDVVDDGVGFFVREARRRSLGMASMHERATSLGGELLVTSRPGAGTRVHLTVPIDTERMTEPEIGTGERRTPMQSTAR